LRHEALHSIFIELVRVIKWQEREQEKAGSLKGEDLLRYRNVVESRAASAGN
jgi:hypothetical protein